MLRTTSRRRYSNCALVLNEAVGLLVEQLEQRKLLSFTLTGVPTWVEQGPASIQQGQVTAAPNNLVSGAIESIAVSPSSANTVFVGTVAGGVWRTTNFANATPTWTPLTDSLPSLYIGSIAFDPSNANTLYVGTGSYSNTFRNQLPQTAVGLFRTTNANAANPQWVPLGAATFANLPIRRVLPTTDPNIILVAADDGGGNGGIFRSINGGTDFTPLTNGTILPTGRGGDLLADPNNPLRYYAAMPNRGVFRSDDRGATWNRIDNRNTAITGIGGSNNIELAVHDAGAATVLYAGVVSGSQLTGVFRDAAGGDGVDNDAANGIDDVAEYNWDPIGAAPAIHTGSQGFNNFAIAADPTDANMVYVAGDRPPHIFRGDAGADTWTSIVGAGAQGNTSPHADSRALVFLNNTTLLEADDGGIFRISNPLDAANNSWTNANGNLRTIEFHSVSYDTQTNRLFGGSQDNGSERQDATNSLNWTRFQGGDGSTQAFDSSDNTAYSLGNNFGSFTRGYGATQLQMRAPAPAGAANFDGLENTSGMGNDRGFTTGAAGFQSYLPVVANRFTAGRLLFGRRGLYESTDRGDTITQVTLPGKAATDVVRALVYGGTRLGVNSNQVFWAGTQNGRLYLRDNAGAITDVTANLTAIVPANFIKGITVDPQDWQRAFVVVGNRVVQTTNGGTSFTEITNNLAGFTTELRHIDFVDTSAAAGDGVPVVGGLGGMFRLLGNNWTEFGLMPNTLVHDTHFVNVDPDGNAADGTGLLIAGTFGRGAWTIPNVAASILTAGSLLVMGNASDNLMSLSLDPNDLTRILVSDGIGSPQSFELDLFETIQFQGLGGDDLLSIDFTLGNPIPFGGVSFDGGAGIGDLLRLTGGSFVNETHTTTGPSSGLIDFDGSTITYSNLAPIEDTVNAVTLTLNASAGADLINIIDGATVNGFDTTEINSGNATFEKHSFANKTHVTVNALGGGDTVTFTGTYDDTPALTTLTVNGGSGDDLFNLAASALIPITLDGGTHVTVDTINLNGLGLDTTLAASTLNTAARQVITYTTVETLALSNGTFNLPGAITPNLDINTAATLYGDGSTTGVLTGNALGTVAPGATLGISTAIIDVGGLDLNVNSTYTVDLNGLLDGAEHDVLNVTGGVDLTGATLAGTLGFGAIPGDEILIIRNDGLDAVVGTFAQGALLEIGGEKFAIDYAYDGDGDGAFNDVALIRYGAALAADPCNPGQLALFVSATTGNDNIRVTPATGSRRLLVEIEAVSAGFTDFFGPFDFKGLTIVFGQSGNDLLTTAAVPSREVWLFGQVGNDTLLTGNNNGLLLGGVGNDTAQGGNAKDILIGGRDEDLLRGGNADSLLIGGYIDFETNTPANREKLCAIFDEWVKGTGGWKGKIDHLTNGGGKNGLVVLNATSVFDDAAIDHLQGGNGKDWFLAHTTGLFADVLDVEKNEVVTEI